MGTGTTTSGMGTPRPAPPAVDAPPHPPGSRVGGYCPACQRPVDAFLDGPNGRPNARCPHCQALERHRFLALLLERLSPGVTVAEHILDIAPQGRIRQLLVDRAGRRYVGVDLNPGRVVDVRGDICRLPFADGAFDLVVCYHVFEHVPDDATAMAEVRRVLDPAGVAVVQVPHRPGQPTDEDPSAPEDERVRRFGQADHVRYYGDDFEDRLRAGGLHPVTVTPRQALTAVDLREFRVEADETVWLCAADPAALPDADVLRAPRSTVAAAVEAERRRTQAERRRADAAEREAARYRAAYDRLATHPAVRTLLAVRRAGIRLRRMLGG